MSLQIRTNKVCSCRGLLLSWRLHYIEGRKKGCMPSPRGWPRKTLLLLPAPLMKPHWPLWLNANVLTSCQTLLIHLAPKIISPQPQKLTVSPDAWALRESLWLVLLGIGCAFTRFYKLSYQSWKHPFGACGKCAWKGWEAWSCSCSGREGYTTCCSGVVPGPDKLPRAGFVGVPLMTVDVRGQQHCMFAMRYCRKGVVIFLLFFISTLFFFPKCTNGI